MLRILSIDGGGIGGLVPLALIRRLFESDLYLVDKADFIAGTSTGGIIALGLAHGISVAQIYHLYSRKGGSIFKRRWFLGRFGLAKAKYDNDGLRAELKALFGDTRLGELKKKVLIPAFDLDGGNGSKRWKAKFFTNYSPDDCEEPVVEVALRSAAAPTYFPTVGSYADGGLVVNNPAACALAQVWTKDFCGGQEPAAEHFHLLSLGCGAGEQQITAQNVDGGIVFWGSNLVDILFDGMVDKDDYLCRRFLGENYLRLSPRIAGERPGLDEYEKADEFQAIADSQDLTEAKAWLAAKW